MPDLMPWHKTWLKDVTYTRVDLVKEGANSMAHIMLAKNRGGKTMTLEEILKGLKPEFAEIVRKALSDKDEAIAKAVADAEQAVAKAKTAETSNQSDEEVLKSIQDPAVRRLMETQIAKTRMAEEAVLKAREAQEESEAIAKAKEVPNLGADEAKMAEVYKKLNRVDSALCSDVFGIFKAASTLITDGGSDVFKTVGTSAGAAAGSAASVSGTADEIWGMIEKAADAITKSSDMTRASAIKKACRDNPELYKAYLDAQRSM